MARARILKPSFFTNDDVALLPALGRLLFAGLWCIADRDGRLEDRPARIGVELLPYDHLDASDVDALLAQIAALGFIVRYEVGNRRYIQVVTFAKHQHPHSREGASTIPPPASTDLGSAEHHARHDLGNAEPGGSTALGNAEPGGIRNTVTGNGSDPVTGEGADTAPRAQGAETAVKTASPRAPRPTNAGPKPMTTGQRETLLTTFAAIPDVEAILETALAHKARLKCADEYLYARNWLRTELQRYEEHEARMARANGRPPPTKPAIPDEYDMDAYLARQQPRMDAEYAEGLARLAREQSPEGASHAAG